VVEGKELNEGEEAVFQATYILPPNRLMPSNPAPGGLTYWAICIFSNIGGRRINWDDFRPHQKIILKEYKEKKTSRHGI
jgi:hypothetical protein